MHDVGGKQLGQDVPLTGQCVWSSIYTTPSPSIELDYRQSFVGEDLEMFQWTKLNR